MEFPNIDPVIFQLGPLSLNFYSLSYMLGIISGLYYARYLCRHFNINISPMQQEQFVVWTIIAILVGGRLGYVLLYDPVKYLSDPITILQTYKGGMSFHGGLLGVIIASYLFCRRHKIPFTRLTDILAVVCPIGIFLGRLANFFNGELYGRVTNVSWGVIFPYSDGLPRHPSQLYEAGLEGLLLFIIMYYLTFKYNILSKQGKSSGVFMICYGVFRLIIEYFREPDAQLGFVLSNITMGQLLSLPMIIIGIFLYAKQYKTAY